MPHGTVEALLDDAKWSHARWLIQLQMQRVPDDHALYAQLALTYFEERRFADAADAARRALLLAPNCPMSLWYYAGILDSSGHARDAIVAYEELVLRGPSMLSHGECGLGRKKAAGLFSDCCQRLSMLHERLGHRVAASRWHARHLECLGRGERGFYTLDDALAQVGSESRHELRLRSASH